ncbi:MAG: hypothetical protein J1E83_12620 [Lachnospiraceae bacterium]|nr:hypothetical protein [Lachnospiraceae bacterium]
MCVYLLSVSLGAELDEEMKAESCRYFTEDFSRNMKKKYETEKILVCKQQNGQGFDCISGNNDLMKEYMAEINRYFSSEEYSIDAGLKDVIPFSRDFVSDDKIQDWLDFVGNKVYIDPSFLDVHKIIPEIKIAYWRDDVLYSLQMRIRDLKKLNVCIGVADCMEENVFDILTEEYNHLFKRTVDKQ